MSSLLGSGFNNFLQGTPGQFDQRSRLGQPQQQGFQNLINAANGSGAAGGFGQAADYYRSLLSDNSPDYQALAATQMRQFRQQTLPGIAEQFAGLGAGALDSSGYRNSVLQANTDLGERLAALRANLRGQGAQGLQGIATQGLGDYFNNTYMPQTPGFLQSAAPGIGSSLTSSLSGYLQNQGNGNQGGSAENGGGGWEWGPALRSAGTGALTGGAAAGPWGAAGGALISLLPHILKLFNDNQSGLE